MLRRPNPLANRRRQAAANKDICKLTQDPGVGNVCAGYTMTGMAGHILPMEALGHPALRFQRI